MKKETILNRLAKFINPAMVIQLKMALSVPDSILICATVHDIIMKYDSTQENEKEVSKLLVALCKSYFASEEETSYKQECLKINSRLKLNKHNGMYYIITGNEHAHRTYSNAHPAPANAWVDCYETLMKKK